MISLHPFEFMAEGSSVDPKTTEADARTEGGCLKTDSGAALLRTTSSQLIDLERSSWCRHGTFTSTLYYLFGTRRFSAGQGKRNMGTSPDTEALTYHLFCL